ncbi:hypothetical protein HMPREF0044_0962 [Gleimia coleocanis DSM 15436]|uniref:Uncharacterized protein n=2 Tax=Gleimia TaxID=2692113 RepID=C0W084_9ACTO|nr:hypothetical protein HMPREF0044_0962 [Gleimia coleocanis DSM 15436]
MPALRSALKVIYTPGITLATPIGLRNDPQATLVLQRGKEINAQFDEALNYLDPFDRRDYLEWLETEAGEEFKRWRLRGFAMAAALESLETGWDQDDTKLIQQGTPAQVQAAVDRAWWWDHNRHWLLVFAGIVLTAGFMTMGPNMSTGLWAVVLGLLGLTGVALVAYAASFWPRWQLRRVAAEYGISLDFNEEEVEETLAEEPLWIIPEGGSALTSAKILNFANWVMLAQPSGDYLLDLTPSELNQVVTTERRQKIVETALGWEEKQRFAKARREEMRRGMIIDPQ